jgi:hypothetical protein
MREQGEDEIVKKFCVEKRRKEKNCGVNLTEQSEDEIVKRFVREVWRKFDRTEGRRDCE